MCYLQAAPVKRHPGRSRKSTPVRASSQPPVPLSAEPGSAEPAAAKPGHPSLDLRPQRARASAQVPTSHPAPAASGAGASGDAPPPAEYQPAASGKAPVGGAWQRSGTAPALEVEEPTEASEILVEEVPMCKDAPVGSQVPAAAELPREGDAKCEVSLD